MTPQQQIYAKLTNDEKRRWWIQLSHEPEEFLRMERELAPLLTSRAARAWLQAWRPDAAKPASAKDVGAARDVGSGRPGGGTFEKGGAN